ncbi:MAG: undecaprenyl/decaprenyl-phosphate alpha-N-acetylglucosaminyl 1-phosphate transferase [Clostridiales bacterium]|jgi:UDP-GlcNAc:undecaprenyl-phosphate GlcNAc-1-phosphate transferase|nr:undecaprenyl/decaprenyl-phosphate alpha-N-acetylglucosaminyl 1-phosphate transferase [Clostridiales bacterium]
MNHDWLLYLAIFSCSFGISIVTTPFAKKLSIKVGAIDQPRSRGMHSEPIPRMGGIAIVSGFLTALGIAAIFMPDVRTAQFLGFVAGALIIVAAGIVDDIRGLKPGTKLVFQIAASLVVIFSGTRVDFFVFPFLTVLDSLAAPFTLIWIVGLTNAVNMIDGLDGLAAGVTTIGALSLLILCVLSGSGLAVVLAAALAGSCLGFLPRNFNPAEVIMGDTGAQFLGYVLAVSSILGVFKAYALLSVVIASFALALPIFDAAFAILRRFLAGKPIMTADRGHLHHKLIDSGYSHKQAVILLYVMSAVSGVIAIVIAIQDERAILVTSICLVIMLMMIYIYRKRTH